MIIMGYALIIIGIIVFIIGIVLFIGYIRQNWEISPQDFEQKIKTSGIAHGTRRGNDEKRREIVKRLGIDETIKNKDFAENAHNKSNYYDKTEEIMD